MHISRDGVIDWLRAVAGALASNKERLTRLDSDIGDGDHGTNMDRGFQAILAKLPDLACKDIGAILKAAGMTLVSTVGGASGPLYGTMFLQMGGAAGSKMELSAADWLAVLRAGTDGVSARGKASPGDKTMLDALLPAVAAVESELASGGELGDCLRAMVGAADAGVAATVPLVARKGRASYLGERSAGHQDPGATSAALLLGAARDAWA